MNRIVKIELDVIAKENLEQILHNFLDQGLNFGLCNSILISVYKLSQENEINWRSTASCSYQPFL